MYVNLSYLQTNLFLKYTDRTPVGYQFWNNYLIKNHNFQIIPFVGKKYYHNLTYFKKIKIAQTKLQPQLQYVNNNCVLMVTAILAETDWITVPCDEKNSLLILCQKSISNTSNKGDMINDLTL